MKKITGFIKAHKKISIGVLISLIILVFLATKLFPAKAKTQYQTAKVEKGAIISSISTSGQVISSNQVDINTQASGFVIKLYVREGDLVTSGQKIADITLDTNGQQANSSAWSSYLSAKNSLDSAQTSLYTLQSDMFTKWDTFNKLAQTATYQNSDGSARTDQRLLAEFNIANDNWLAAEAKYKQQQAVISQSQAALNSSWLSYQLTSPEIYAPINGTISSITVAEGMSLNSLTTSSTSTTKSSQKIAVIQNESMPMATFNLSEIDITKVKTGQKATITLDSLTGKTFTGKVVSVDRTGSITSSVTNYPIIIQFDTSVPEILSNMSTSASIITNSKDNVLLVPSTTIQTQGDASVVRVLKNNKVSNVAVETGLTSDTQTEITSGLSEGEEVVTSVISATTTSTTGSSVFSGLGGARGGTAGFGSTGGR